MKPSRSDNLSNSFRDTVDKALSQAGTDASASDEELAVVASRGFDAIGPESRERVLNALAADSNDAQTVFDVADALRNHGVADRLAATKHGESAAAFGRTFFTVARTGLALAACLTLALGLAIVFGPDVSSAPIDPHSRHQQFSPDLSVATDTTSGLDEQSTDGNAALGGKRVLWVAFIVSGAVCATLMPVVIITSRRRSRAQMPDGVETRDT